MGLRGAPAQAAERIYTGVLYEALDLVGLPPAARARAGSSVLIVSALFGLLRPGDVIPAYRLSMDVDISRIGPLARVWRRVLDPVIVTAAGDGPIVDCRSATYAAAWKPSRDLAGRVVQVRVLQEVAGKRTIVSHMAKKTRGEVARLLLLSEGEISSVGDVAGVVGSAFTVELTPARPGVSRTLDVIV
jgi:cytoplasmic iron level regulating protein YaaA (DUF328/UPF0246 family)